MITDPKRILMSSRTIMSMFVIAKLLDLGTTLVALSFNFNYESNPISVFLLYNYGWWSLSVFGLSVAVIQASVLIWYQSYLVRRNAPNIVLSICRGGIILCVCITMVAVLNNFIIILLSVA
jgi:hypothetical protein